MWVTPTAGYPDPRFVENVHHLSKTCKYPEIEWDAFSTIQSCMISASRCLVLDSAISRKAHYLLMQDDDVEIPLKEGHPHPIEALVRLMEEKDCLVTAAVVRQANMYQGPNVRMIDPDLPNLGAVPQIIAVYKGLTKQHEVDCVGTAFFLIDVRKAAKITNPRFACISKDAGGEWVNLGEDMVFCLKARAMGFKIWVDATIETRHFQRRAGDLIWRHDIWEAAEIKHPFEEKILGGLRCTFNPPGTNLGTKFETVPPVIKPSNTPMQGWTELPPVVKL